MGWQYKEKMKKRAALLIILSLATTILGSSAPQTRIEIKDNWYYLNGQKFFIKALGYEIGARPGQHPYKGVQADDLDLMKFDLRVIKEAGYNTIRTWSPFTEPQLKLAQDSGLKLIMGVDVDPDKDYGDPKFIKDCEDNLKKVLSYAKKYDCIITYLLINEPQTDQKTGQSSLLTQTGA
jgi:beta-galactosidase/beta-glucuronidase